MSESLKLSSDREEPSVDAISLPECPVGEHHCQVIDEVAELREEVLQLSREVRTDPLTGLFNFRYLRQVLELEMERTRRSNQPTALLMVDLDHFKQINDRWGHEAGNSALISTAKLLRHMTRRLDIPCRYGGEEFAVVLPSTDMLTAIQVAERIRASIAAQPVVAGGVDISLTASLGVEVYYSSLEETAEQFVARADQCLYRAKQSGRNRVCHGGTTQRPDVAVSREEKEMLADIFVDNGGDDK